MTVNIIRTTVIATTAFALAAAATVLMPTGPVAASATQRLQVIDSSDDVETYGELPVGFETHQASYDIQDVAVKVAGDTLIVTAELAGEWADVDGGYANLVLADSATVDQADTVLTHLGRPGQPDNDPCVDSDHSANQVTFTVDAEACGVQLDALYVSVSVGENAPTGAYAVDYAPGAGFAGPFDARPSSS